MAGSAAEASAWAEAARAFLIALSRALEELYLAHGGARRNIKVDLHGGSRGWTHLPAPLHLPGWRRRAAERSHGAQRAFVARAEQAAQDYHPVRAEIERRLDAARAAQRAEAKRRRALEQRQQEVAEEVGARRCWVWVDRAKGPVFVYRDDVPLVEPVSAGQHSQPLTAPELESAVRAAVDDREWDEVEWDSGACIAVERDCEQLGVYLSFECWWDLVTQDLWEQSGLDGRTTTHATSHHSSHGVGGGFDGGSYGVSHGTSF